jgi:5-methylthioadenosine/S-adenosylhomocysteine deaminase
MIDILIRHATVVTVDSERRVLEDGTIAVKADRIVAVGSDSEVCAVHGDAAQIIDGRHMTAIPGLIDGHAHAGHGLVRSLGAGDGNAWFNACAEIYARGSTVDFWRFEARLALLERLKAGVTTSLTLLGGGADVYRTDDPVYGDAHCESTRESGLRTILAVGPGQRPFPRHFTRISDEGAEDFDISFARQLQVSEDLIRRWNDVRDRRTGICLIMPVYRAADLEDREGRAEIEMMSQEVAALRARHDVLFTQDGHSDGTIAVARDLGLLGPYALLSHSVDLTSEDITALKDTGANVVHNPSAIMSVYGRCPAPELIGEGVTVCIGSDAGAPDRGFDMFRHMAQCMHYHRRHFRDPAWMPPGKVLEMTTIDSASALGLDDVLGSLEVGKKADIVLVDMKKPHLYPPNMPVTRLAHFANAGDVDTVIVDGSVLLSQRKAMVVDEEEILKAAAAELTLTLERTGLQALTNEPEDFWGVNRRQNKGYPVKK